MAAWGCSESKTYLRNVRLGARDRFKWVLASLSVYMYEDLSEIYQAALEDERKRKYMKEIGDWLVEEYFEPFQAS
jgi:hypothetical protein